MVAYIRADDQIQRPSGQTWEAMIFNTYMVLVVSFKGFMNGDAK